MKKIIIYTILPLFISVVGGLSACKDKKDTQQKESAKTEVTKTVEEEKQSQNNKSEETTKQGSGDTDQK